MYIDYKKMFLDAKDEIRRTLDYYETVTESCDSEEDECVYYSGYCSGLNHALAIIEELRENVNPKKKDTF